MKKYLLAIVFGSMLGCFGSISCEPKSKVVETLDGSERAFLVGDSETPVSVSITQPTEENQCLPDTN